MPPLTTYRNPLRTVKLYTQLLAREYQGKLDAKGDEFIAGTIEAASEVEMLLRDLREYWLVNEPLGNLVPVDCEDVLRKIMQPLRVPVTESGAIATHDPLPTVSAHHVGLVMLFQNLLGNAIKYQRSGEQPRVHVAAEKKSHMWRFSVKDDGIGIETKYLEQIFAPFKRLHGLISIRIGCLFSPPDLSDRHRRRCLRALRSDTRTRQLATRLLQPASRDVSGKTRGPMEHNRDWAFLQRSRSLHRLLRHSKDRNAARERSGY